MTATGLEDLIGQLRLDEKAELLEGRDAWYTRGIPRLGIRSLCLTDGPHGVRKVRHGSAAFDVGDNEPSTAFPTSATVANTWDPAAAHAMGVAIARECRALGVDVLLAPGVNIKRNPLCGRNFEYYSEDPLLSGELGAAFVRGVEGEGVATAVKHFAANSNEEYRFSGDSLVDERALREIYLRQFERVVKQGGASTVMTAYNAVNGTFAAEHRELLTGILREEWGFDGVVMTDWGGTHDRVAGILAGCDLDMPGDVPHNRAAIVEAATDGRLPAEALDASVRRMLALAARPAAEDPAAPDLDAHAELSRRIATAGAVLLANDGTLPLDRDADGIVVVGELFERMRFQGAGSSLITPTHLVSPRDAFDARGIRYRYARGYRALDTAPDADLEREAREAARGAGTVLFFGGLTDLEESEGFDRATMALGAAQTALLDGLLDDGARVVLVLFAGSPVELPMADRLAAVLDMYLPGMRGGDAVADLLFGDATPSGKLAESWPMTAADASSAADFDRGGQARYYESVYVGYRYYDAARTALRFPFGHGLSYTTFAYRDLAVAVEGGHVRVEVDVANTGSRDGAEVVQLYVRNNRGEVFKPEKELRAFARVEVPAGGVVRARLEFDLADLSYWDVRDHDWVLENGDYEILVAASAADIRLTAPLPVTTGRASRSPYPPEVDAAYATPPAGVPDVFPALLGRDIPDLAVTRRLTLESRLVDARRSLLGAIIYRAVVGRVAKNYRAALRLPDGIERDARVKSGHFLVRMMPFNTLRVMVMSSSGELPFHVAEGIALIAAFHPIRGVRRILSGGTARR